MQDLLPLVADLGEAGAIGRRGKARLIEHLENRYLLNEDAIRSATPAQWKALAGLLAKDLPLSKRLLWSGRIYRAYLGGAGLSALDDSQYGDLNHALRRLAKDRFAAKLPSRKVQQENRVPQDKSSVSEGNPLSPQTALRALKSDDADRKAERIRALEYLQKTVLIDNVSARSLPPKAWYEVAGAVLRDLPAEARELWGRRLWDAYVADTDVLSAVQPNDCRNLIRAVWRLSGDTAAGEALAKWMEATRCWASMSGTDLLTVIRGTIFDREAEAIRLPCEVLRAHKEEVVAALLQSCVADDGSIDPRDNTAVLAVCRALDVLGEKDTSALVQTQARLAGLLDGTPGDPSMVGQFIDGQVRLLFRRVAGSRGGERNEVWDSGLRQIRLSLERAGVCLRLPRDLWHDLEELLLVAGVDELPPQHILADLGSLPQDSACQEELATRLAGLLLVQTAADSSRALATAVEEAIVLDRDGNSGEALKKYQQVLDRLPANGPGRPLAALAVARIMLATDSEGIPNIPAVSSVPGGGHLIAEFAWNLSLRALARKTMLAPPESRLDLWGQGMAELAQACPRAVTLLPSTLTELDRLMMSLGSPEEKGLSPLDVLTDLLVLAPDAASAQTLQTRRMNYFVDLEAWPEAAAAAKLLILLSTCSEQGPMPEVQRYKEIVFRAGGSVEDCLRVEATWLLGQSPKALLSAPHSDLPTEPQSLALDDLACRARAELTKDERHIDPRRAAYLAAFAGQPNEAMRALVKAMNTQWGKEARDLPVILAMVSGGFGAYCDVVRATCQGDSTPQDPDLARLVAACLERANARRTAVGSAAASSPPVAADWEPFVSWRGRLTRWGVQALSAGSYPWAEATCLWFQQCGGNPGQANEPLDVLIRKSPSVNRSTIEKQLYPLLPHLPPETGRTLLLRAARLLFDRADFAACAETLAELRTRGLEPTGPKDSQTEVMWAISLMRLRRTDEAFAELKAELAGPDDNLAQALLLVGCLHQEEGRYTQALDAFRQVTRRFPDTLAAWTACEMAIRLHRTLSAGPTDKEMAQSTEDKRQW